MISAEEIRSQTFEKSMRGYRAEDVNAFLAQIAATVDQLNEDKAAAEKKVFVLAEKLEEYQAQENTLKSALLNAQRLGENVIYEAKQKGDAILNEATTKAKRIIDMAEDRERDEKENLRRLETEVSTFKSNILGLYQQHIESLTALDHELNDVHVAVFGEEVKQENPAAMETPAFEQEAASDEVIDHAGSIVDSYQEQSEEE